MQPTSVISNSKYTPRGSIKRIRRMKNLAIQEFLIAGSKRVCLAAIAGGPSINWSHITLWLTFIIDIGQSNHRKCPNKCSSPYLIFEIFEIHPHLNNIWILLYFAKRDLPCSLGAFVGERCSFETVLIEGGC